MLKLIFENEKKIEELGIFFYFKGPLSQGLLTEIGEILEKKMSFLNTGKLVLMRVFYMVVEMAQNIIRYSADRSLAGDEWVSFGFIAVGMEAGSYYVASGNRVKSAEAADLKDRLEKLQKMSRDEIKNHFQQKLKEKSDDGPGAGLGLIDIAKKAGKPLEFEMIELDGEMYYFMIKSTV